MILSGYTLVLFSTVRLVLSTIEITKTNNVLWHQYASNTFTQYLFQHYNQAGSLRQFSLTFQNRQNRNHSHIMQ